MKTAALISVFGALFAVSGCDEAMAPMTEAAPMAEAAPVEASMTIDPITQAISGKRLVAPRGDFIDVGADGRVTGMVGPDQSVALSGIWEIRNGQWCRTLTAPASLAGTACQDANA